MTKLPEPITTPPTEEELTSRVEKIRAKMDEKNYDYYVSFDPVNIYYLTNFANLVHERPFILIIPKKGTVRIVCPLLETSHVKARARLPLDYKIYYEFPAPKGENWFDIYRAEIEDSASVAVESAMPVGIYNRTPGKIVVDDIIDDVRLVKTKYEIGRTVHGCQIISEGHEKLLEITRPGAMEITVYGETVRAMMGKALGEIPEANLIVTRFLAAVWPPSISHDPHRIPKPFMPMEEGGPQVSIIGGQVDGYGVEIERTFFLGKVPENAKKPFDTMIEARSLAYELAVPGARFSDIDKKVRKIVIDAGYEDYILHRTGHGMGITGHEAPFLAIGDDREIVPDMIISVEPGIYIEGQGGFRHSDTVLITETGNVKLTSAPETMDELTIPL